jgi:hypothetical protein
MAFPVGKALLESVLSILSACGGRGFTVTATLGLIMRGDFVIQLRKDSDPALGEFRGRVEHIDSGFSGSFQARRSPAKEPRSRRGPWTAQYDFAGSRPLFLIAE